MAVQGIDLGKYKLGWHDTEQNVFQPKKGLNEEIVREISWRKSEPEWMTKFRLNSLKRFERKPMLPWFAKNIAIKVVLTLRLGAVMSRFTGLFIAVRVRLRAGERDGWDLVATSATSLPRATRKGRGAR